MNKKAVSFVFYNIILNITLLPAYGANLEKGIIPILSLLIQNGGQTCTNTSLGNCTTESECEGVGGFWYNGVCNNLSLEGYGTIISSTGQIWLDRNLGASRAAISKNDREAYGDLYQWGRGSDGHEKIDSEILYEYSSTNQPGHGYFIRSYFQNSFDWRETRNDNLWQQNNGINNPCPAGFRVPTIEELEKEFNVDSENKWGVGYGGSSYEPIFNNLKLAIPGFRNSTTGYVQSSGEGRYWSSTTYVLTDIRRFSFYYMIWATGSTIVHLI